MAFKDYSIGVNLIGRDVSASKALNKLGFAAKSTGDKLEMASKKATYVIGAMTGAAVLFAKAAMEDQKSAVILAKTLENVAGAGTKQVAQVEEFIKTQSLFAAKTDDEIRPAFDRLVRSTRNIGEAQKLTSLALEISAAKGKSVEEVATALAKAYDGNINALKRIGVAVPKATNSQKVYGTQLKVVNGQLKSVQVQLGKTAAGTVKFSDVVTQLGKDFKGSVNSQMDTAAYKFDKFKVVLGETQETLGYMLLPYLEKFAGLLIKMAPWVERNKDNIIKFAVGLTAFAVAIKAISAAYKVMLGLQIAAGLFGIGTAAGAAAAGGVALSAAWLPVLAAIMAAAAAVGGLSYFLNKYGADSKLKKENLPSWSTESDWKGLTDRPTFMSNVPRHAKGGIVTRPQIGMIGEAGPEAIIPLDKFGSLGGNTIVNYIQGSLVSQSELTRITRDGMAQLLRRKGLNPAILGV